MHKSALVAANVFFQNYCAGGTVRILDVGSMDINGSLRQVAPPGSAYTGVDMAAGRGVDLVLQDPHVYPFDDGSFDVVVSTSCFEHDAFFWVSFLEIARVLRDGGLLYLNAPSNGPYHPHPTDNWRFYPDAGHALCAWGRRNGVEIALAESFILNQMDQTWNDFVGVFRKGPAAAPARFVHAAFPLATNIWTPGAAALARREDTPEDKRRLEAVVRNVVGGIQAALAQGDG